LLIIFTKKEFLSKYNFNMSDIKSLAIYCGSSMGADPAFQDAAVALGRYCATNQIKIVYGGAQVGLMGAVADATLDYGGKAIGILPHFLQRKEITHEGLTELHIVNTMHERKQMMIDLADAFIALPGGYGTLDEFFEVVTWAQIGLHHKPIGLLNINGFYDPILAFMEQAKKAKLLRTENLDIIQVGDYIPTLLQKMKDYKSEVVPKWL
jgi:uncharacterized protein (TIGR00730 family)